MRIALTMLAGLSLGACAKSHADSPVEAYTSFSRAIQRGDYKAAYAALSQQTQNVLEAKTKEVSAASGSAIKDDPAAMAFSGTPRPDPLTEVKLVRQDGDRAVLGVASGTRFEQVAMVHEQSGWKVDLTDRLNASGRPNATP